MRIKRINISDVEYIAHRMAQKFMAWDEPIPEFGSRFPYVLESCLEVPFQTFNRRSFYKGVKGKGAILFYLMIKNHPFRNGNKRIAVMTLLVFLGENKKWLRVGNEELYEFAKHIAASDPKQRKLILFSIQGFIKEYLIEF